MLLFQSRFPVSRVKVGGEVSSWRGQLNEKMLSVREVELQLKMPWRGLKIYFEGQIASAPGGRREAEPLLQLSLTPAAQEGLTSVQAPEREALCPY